MPSKKNTKISFEVSRLDVGEATQMRLDAAQTLNLRHELEHVRAQTYDKKYPMFKGRQMVAVSNEAPSGAETVAFESFDEVGDAEIGSDYSSEGPEVNVSKERQAQSIFGVKNKYSFSVQELRAAAMAGNKLPTRKAFAARRIQEQKHDNIILLGDSNWGLAGLFKLSDTCTYTVPVGDDGSKYWSAKTADEILLDMFAMENTIITTTLETEAPDTLVLPLSEYNRVKTKRMGDGIDGTVLQFFMKNAQTIKNVIPHSKLESNAGWTGKRMMSYRNDAEVLEYIEPQPFEQMAPQAKGYLTTTLCHSRTAGIELHYPKGVCYGDEIGA